VGLNFDVLVTALSSPSLAAKKATEKIPIVMVAVADPVASAWWLAWQDQVEMPPD
jgi:ABC-type uncharacterized transport system substrate-binding protein